MPAPQLPASGDISDDLVTVADQKDNLEALRDVLFRAMGADATESLVISAGVVTPTTGVILVDTEGAVASDDLDRIDPANFRDGSLILVAALSSARTVVLRNMQGGSGQLLLQTDYAGAPQDLSLEELTSTVLLAYSSPLDMWVEKSRNLWGQPADLRAQLGLGTAALADEGPGNGLDADTLDGLEASAFLLAAANAADSDLLDGIDSSGFVQTALTSEQTVAGAFQAKTQLTADGAVAADPIVQLERDGNRKALLRHDTTDEALELRTYQDGDPATVRSRFRIGRPGGVEQPEYRRSSDGGWHKVLHEGIAPLVPAIYDATFALGSATGSWASIWIPPHSLMPSFSVAYNNPGLTEDVAHNLDFFWGSAHHGDAIDQLTYYNDGGRIPTQYKHDGASYSDGLLYLARSAEFATQSAGSTNTTVAAGRTSNRMKYANPIQFWSAGVNLADSANSFVNQSGVTPPAVGMNQGLVYCRWWNVSDPVYVRVRFGYFPDLETL